MGKTREITILIGPSRVILKYDTLVDEDLAITKITVNKLKLQFYLICHRDYDEFVVKKVFDFNSKINFPDLADDELSEIELSACHQLLIFLSAS